MKLLNRIVFLAGWLLSPFTTWNDVFINIPLAYFAAGLFYKFYRCDFTIFVIIFYWLSNGLGLVLMYISGRNVLKGKRLTYKSVFLTLLFYSLALFLLGKLIALTPFQAVLSPE